MTKQTISVNGTVYDSETGMPLRVERGTIAAPQRGAHQLHTQTQRSRTLNRKYVRHTASTTQTPAAPAQHEISVHHKPAAAEVKRSEQVARFAPTHTQKPTQKQVFSDIAPAKHHLAERANVRMSAKKPVARTVKPSDVLKKEAIANASSQMPPKASKKDFKPAKKQHGAGRRLSVGAASLAILLLGGYLTYLNMPALSTRVAASQAGISASYPNYQPSGYSLSGPVAYQQGSVSMKFAANGGPQSFTLSQSRSDWDSSAVLENYVTPEAGDDYTTTNSGGLTIYTFGDDAAWVNDGILYTIRGDATLSQDQVQRIATSL